jgi:hypothetical protein
MLGRIYKIEGGGKFYIGSTFNSLKERLKKHKSKSNESISKNRKVYNYFKEIGWDKCVIILIREIEVLERKQLLLIEKEELLNVINDINCLNTCLPITTLEEKKKRDSEYSKKRREDNPERERERLQKWRTENPDKRKEQVIRERSKKNIRRE